MAKAILPVNYKNDILAAAMNGSRKFKITDNGDGTVTLEDVSTYDQVGSEFGAAQMNATNQAVNDSVDKSKVLQTLEENAASTDDENVAGSKALAELNKNLSALNDNGAINGMSVESDGAYISYTLDGETVKKKLGSGLDNANYIDITLGLTNISNNGVTKTTSYTCDDGDIIAVETLKTQTSSYNGVDNRYEIQASISHDKKTVTLTAVQSSWGHTAANISMTLRIWYQ